MCSMLTCVSVSAEKSIIPLSISVLVTQNAYILQGESLHFFSEK